MSWKPGIADFFKCFNVEGLNGLLSEKAGVGAVCSTETAPEFPLAAMCLGAYLRNNTQRTGARTSVEAMPRHAQSHEKLESMAVAVAAVQMPFPSVTPLVKPV